MSQVQTGGYIRHRDRMVQESVFEDLQDTLIACRWLSGTTSRPVVDPYDVPAGWKIVTTAPEHVLKLVGKREDQKTNAEIVLLDYFPEVINAVDQVEKIAKTEYNTFAIDPGITDDPIFVEMGSNMMEQPYTFTMAFYASSDGIAKAVMNDLRDRYQGRIVRDDNINLYNFNDPSFSDESLPVCRMEVNSFRYTQDATRTSSWGVNLYFAELQISDYVDAQDVSELATPLTPGPVGP